MDSTALFAAITSNDMPLTALRSSHNGVTAAPLSKAQQQDKDTHSPPLAAAATDAAVTSLAIPWVDDEYDDDPMLTDWVSEESQRKILEGNRGVAQELKCGSRDRSERLKEALASLIEEESNFQQNQLKAVTDELDMTQLTLLTAKEQLKAANESYLQLKEEEQLVTLMETAAANLQQELEVSSQHYFSSLFGLPDTSISDELIAAIIELVENTEDQTERLQELVEQACHTITNSPMLTSSTATSPDLVTLVLNMLYRDKKLLLSTLKPAKSKSSSSNTTAKSSPSESSISTRARKSLHASKAVEVPVVTLKQSSQAFKEPQQAQTSASYQPSPLSANHNHIQSTCPTPAHFDSQTSPLDLLAAISVFKASNPSPPRPSAVLSVPSSSSVSASTSVATSRTLTPLPYPSLTTTTTNGHASNLQQQPPALSIPMKHAKFRVLNGLVTCKVARLRATRDRLLKERAEINARYRKFMAKCCAMEGSDWQSVDAVLQMLVDG